MIPERLSMQGALVAFSTLSALYNVVTSRPLFLRERSARYYRYINRRLCIAACTYCFNSPTAWLFSRFIYDVIPLRIIPTIVVATMSVFLLT